MKTLYISLISMCLFTQTSQAQFTLLDLWHAPEHGSSASYKQYDSTGAIPKNTGASQTWDFSALSMKTGSNMTSYSNASVVPTATMFPSANLVGNEGNNNMSYYIKSTSQFELVGQSTGTINSTYTNTKIEMKFPFTHGNTFTDGYATNWTKYNVTGSVTTTASGFGTVTLPGGSTFTNCLQIHKMDKMMFADTAIVPIDNFTTTVHSYEYYSDQTSRYPIIRIEYSSIEDATGADKFTNIEVIDFLAVGLNDYNFDASFAIYPNPAKESFKVMLSNANAEPVKMQFYSMTGALVKSVDLGSTSSIESNVDISGLGSGIYMVKTTMGSKSSTRKLIVE